MHNTGTIPLYHDMLGRFASSRKLNVSVNRISPVRSVVRAVAVPQEPPEPRYLPEEKIKQKLEILFRMNQEIHHISWIIKQKACFPDQLLHKEHFSHVFPQGEANNEKVSSEKMRTCLVNAQVREAINDTPNTFYLLSTDELASGEARRTSH